MALPIDPTKVEYIIHRLPIREVGIDWYEVEGIRDEHPKSIHHILRAFLASEKAGIHTVRYPLDWWQHFKVRWFPRWLLSRYPAKYRTEEFEFGVLYPNFRPSVRDQKVIEYCQYKRCGVEQR